MKMLRRLLWIGIGAGLVWFFDPEHGPQRRAEAKAKLEGFTKPEPGPRQPISLADETRDPLHERTAAR
jgi:hypothetical protein